MEQKEYTTIVLEASEGMTITNAAEVDIDKRTLTKRLYLAATDSPDNWREIPDAEADMLRAAATAARQARADAARSTTAPTEVDNE